MHNSYVLKVPIIISAIAFAFLAYTGVALAASVTVGNPATNRATTDSFTNFTIVDTNNPVSANGTLDTFTYYAANLNPFEFVIVDAGNVVKYISPQITPASTGVHTFNALVPVQAGWNLGVHFDSSGTIPFDGGGSLATYTANNSGSPVLNVALVPAGTTARTYSWNASGTTNLIVDDNKVECPTAAYTTIQSAVNAASSGDTITVCAGTYPEHVAVNKSLTINGPNVGVAGNSGSRVAEAIVDGTDTDAPFAITANNVTIDGFTVKNGSNGQLFSGIWSQTGTQNSKVQNNIITQNEFGVWAQCGGNCLIQNNLFDGNNKPGSPGGAGISADSTTGLTIDKNEFKNHTVGNPILFQAVAPGAHTNLIVSNNNFHDNSGASVIYALAITGGAFTGNTIAAASDVTGISFSGADKNISVTGNTITGAARGVRVEDHGYYGGSGGNSNITINKNSLANDSEYGAGNLSGYTGNLDATCNWWGNSSGPGSVGPGTGSPVTTNVTFQPWLTTSDLVNGPCNGPLPPTTVTIVKNVDGVHATAANASSASFPMIESWTATNFSGSNVAFPLSPVGLNTANPYEAVTAPAFASGASYDTHEDTSGSTVGATCAAGKPFALVGYSSGDTLATAQAAGPSPASPSFTNMLTNKFVIVWNKKCVPPTLTIVKHALGGDTTFNFQVGNGSATTSTPLLTSGGWATSSPQTLIPGTYNVNELTLAGWDLSGSTCIYNGQSIGSIPAPPPGVAGSEKITVDPGDSITCTFTNKKKGHIIVDKVTTPSGDPQSFHFQTGGAGYTPFDLTDAAAPNDQTLASGHVYGVTENATPGWTKTSAVCTGTLTFGSFSPGLINLHPGETVTCTFVNTKLPSPPLANACSLLSPPYGYTLVTGSPGNDVVTLAPFAMFKGNGGDDRVIGRDGDYIICLGAGNDVVSLGDGDDTIDAGGGNNAVITHNGNAFITSGAGNDTIKTGNGIHVISAGDGKNSVLTGSGADTITTGSGNDVIDAGAGIDSCNAGGGTNTVLNCP